MIADYRNTKYCEKLTRLLDKKNDIKKAILIEHPRVKDMHTYISKNSLSFKQQFIEAYNGKCAYCGVSIEIISWKMFEIDHFVPKESSRFKNKSQAGYIENLVLSCYDCNRAKGDLELSDDDYDKVNPDGYEITKSFFRDDEYYIRVSKSMEEDNAVNKFYSQLKLGSQMHRIDYLLMSMRGLRNQITDKHPAHTALSKAIDLLQQKRNLIR